jgi:hypothetical protein
MKRSSRLRKKSTLSDSLDHHLNMYAVAAGAAGVGMLALAQPAQARIVYTPAYKQISALPGQDGILLDLNHDGVNDFVFLLFYSVCTGCGFNSDLLVSRPNRSISNAIWKVTSVGCATGCASALPAGVRVGGTNPSHFSKSAGGMAGVGMYYRSGRKVYAYGGPGLTVVRVLRVVTLALDFISEVKSTTAGPGST